MSRSRSSIDDQEATFNARVIELQQRADRLVVMYQTPLHWSVDGWTSVYRKAKAGSVTSINSPLVATGRNGYRFCLRVYPFGRDSGWLYELNSVTFSNAWLYRHAVATLIRNGEEEEDLRIHREVRHEKAHPFGQYASSPDNRANCYAELAVSSQRWLKP